MLTILVFYGGSIAFVAGAFAGAWCVHRIRHRLTIRRRIIQARAGADSRRPRDPRLPSAFDPVLAWPPRQKGADPAGR